FGESGEALCDHLARHLAERERRRRALSTTARARSDRSSDGFGERVAISQTTRVRICLSEVVRVSTASGSDRIINSCLTLRSGRILHPTRAARAGTPGPLAVLTLIDGGGRSMDEKQFLDAWEIHNRINLYLLDAIEAEHLNDHLASKGRSVGEQFAHLHNVRL